MAIAVHLNLVPVDNLVSSFKELNQVDMEKIHAAKDAWWLVKLYDSCKPLTCTQIYVSFIPLYSSHSKQICVPKLDGYGQHNSGESSTNMVRLCTHVGGASRM